jgi:hypothetical protein
MSDRYSFQANYDFTDSFAYHYFHSSRFKSANKNNWKMPFPYPDPIKINTKVFTEQYDLKQLFMKIEEDKTMPTGNALIVSVAGFHEEKFDAWWVYTASNCNDKLSINDRLKQIFEWLINNGHFPFPVEEYQL